ncbi:hypothetical protein JM79_2112 [Gramella sp. Hel_I_59]|uniref:hypothetical protein n=1 Tax=Gramella sp. Hel_I_59 TaxID=1249978 RepID=UPI0011500695|nr:hypothetical protein [Gramella sp. Hel_I_59]TQI71185.1 hypothetical protein JM79_2112 [Gramella sp. Hel_I_59]
MMKDFLLLILIFPTFLIAQDFELKNVNAAQIRKEIKSSGEELDPIYIYLTNNYKPTSERESVQKYDYLDYSICAFEQEFENVIKYSTKSCQEAGGITNTIQLPKIQKSSITNWIEKIYKAELTDIPNVWNSDQTIYGPEGGEAGCYYEIKENENNYTIENYCGC